MAIINLKEFYPWYTHDEYIEVSDEVAVNVNLFCRFLVKIFVGFW